MRLHEMLNVEPTASLEVLQAAYNQRKLEFEQAKNTFEQLKDAFEREVVAVPKIRQIEEKLALARERGLPEYAIEDLEKARRKILFKHGFLTDSSKTRLVEIFIPFFINIVGVPNSKKLAFGVPLPSQAFGSSSLSKIENPVIGVTVEEYKKDNGQMGIKCDAENWIIFERLAAVLTELSKRAHLQFGYTYEEALKIARNRPGNSAYYNVEVAKICVPECTLSIVHEDVWACEGDVVDQQGMSKGVFKAPIFARGSQITSDQIAEVRHVVDEDDYAYRKSVKFDPFVINDALGSRKTINPNYKQGALRSPTHAAAALFSANTLAAASQIGVSSTLIYKN